MAGCDPTASAVKASSSSDLAWRNSMAALLRCLAGRKSAFKASRVIGDAMRFLSRPWTEAFSYMKPSEATTGSTKRTRDTGQQNSGSSSKSLSSFTCISFPSTRPWPPPPETEAATAASSMPSNDAICTSVIPRSAKALAATACSSLGAGAAVGGRPTMGGCPGGRAALLPDALEKGQRGASGPQAALAEEREAELPGTDIAS
mmetsp:Transcript_108178/g.279762  ORF Transcript_108178/g.279762 Transcript_108178/m.279762 type:complete len:203 (-) Transcript_108178:2005-2613(-)